MKKFGLVVSAVTMAIGLTACSGEEEAKKEEKVAGEVSSEKAGDSATNLKKPFMKFYLDLVKTINVNDTKLNEYEGTEKPTPELAVEASESAATVANEIKNAQIPAELSVYQSQIEEALSDLAASYEAKAAVLKEKSPSFDETNAAFTQGEEKLSNVFKELKLFPTSLSSELQ